MERRTRRWVATAAALVWALVGLQPAATSAAPEPVRIMILGDSVAQGSAGDWTWRYRVWRALEAAGVEVDFVGPHDDLFDNVTYEFGSQAYADPSFDRDHAARWGAALAFPDKAMSDLMTDYQPDIVIETRGYNDLTWLQGRPDEVRSAMAGEIAAARTVDPSVAFVLAQLPQVWQPNVSDFNASLSDFVEDQSQPGSQIVAAATGSGFVEGVDTWDQAHYTATGELKFAAGVVDALADLGVGLDYPRPLPAVVNGHWGAPLLAASASDGAARLTWQRPPGASATYVWRRDVTVGQGWERLPTPVEGDTWLAGGLVNAHRYAFRLQSAKGAAISGTYSDEVEVVPLPPPPGPLGPVAVVPGQHRLTLTWGAVPSATSYVVSWVGRTTGHRGSRALEASSLTVTGLLAGERYDVTVTPFTLTVPGPSAGASARPTGPVAAPPRRLQAKRVAPHRVRLTWRPGPRATSYAVWQRSRGPWRLVRTTSSQGLTVRGVSKGITRFKVRAHHQQLAGRWSEVVAIQVR